MPGMSQSKGRVSPLLLALYCDGKFRTPYEQMPMVGIRKLLLRALIVLCEARSREMTILHCGAQTAATGVIHVPS